MAKMSEVEPMAYISGLGQYEGDPDYGFAGLGQMTDEAAELYMGFGWLGASDEDVMMSLSGVGSLSFGFDQMAKKVQQMAEDVRRRGIKPPPLIIANKIVSASTDDLVSAVRGAILKTPALAKKPAGGLFAAMQELQRRGASIGGKGGMSHMGGKGAGRKPAAFPFGMKPMPIKGAGIIASKSIGGLGATPPPGRPLFKPLPPRPAPTSVMNAIIANAKEMNAKTAMVAKARAQVAKKNPIAAVKLANMAKKAALPGTNVAQAVKNTLNEAAKKAMVAKKNELAAKKLLAQSDKRGAAAKAVVALTAAREAATLANRAEKTRLATSLDILSNTLKTQADYIDGLVKEEVAKVGQTPRTAALSATAQALRAQVKRLQAQGAAVASLPNVPANAPSQQRIAELANKFNIRTAKKSKFMLDRGTISVLGDLAEDPMAQVNDYEGALSYYGVDGLGQLMADMEFDNYEAAFSGLSGAIHGLGFTDTVPLLAQTDNIVDEAQALAQQAYTGVIVPAAGLSGLDDGFFDSLKSAVDTVTSVGSKVLDAGKKVVSQAQSVINSPAVKQATSAITNLVKPKPVPAAAKPPPAIPPAPVKPTVVEKAKEVVQETAQKVEEVATTKVGGVPVWAYAAGGVALLGGLWFFTQKKSNPALPSGA